MTAPILQSPQYRLAHHYLDKMKQAESGVRRGRENREHWFNTIQQDWAQIKQWQAWAAGWMDREVERARLCARFPTEALAVMTVRLPVSEQFVWVRQALDAAQHVQDSELERSLLYQLSFLSISLELPDQAEQYANELVERAEAAHDDLNLGRACFLLGAVAFVRGKYDLAEAEFSKSLPRLQACDAAQEIGKVWLGLGRVANVRGNYQKARSHYLQYLDASTTMGNEQAALEAHMALAGVHLALRDSETAEQHAQRAVALARPLGRSRFLPPALFSVAHAQKWLGKYESACTHYAEGIEVARALSSAPSTIANGLHGLGQARYLLGDYAAALVHFEDGLAVARETRFLLRVVEIAHDMVFVHVVGGDFDAARARLREALAAARQLATPHFMAKALAAAIVLWQQTGDLEQAAVWAGLLNNYREQLHPTLFNPVVYERLEAELGAERYHDALEQGKTLALDRVVAEIAALLD
jgi:tetratricopeptide (TPR) repeat protein